MNSACMLSVISFFISALSLFHALFLTTVKYLLFLWLTVFFFPPSINIFME